MQAYQKSQARHVNRRTQCPGDGAVAGGIQHRRQRQAGIQPLSGGGTPPHQADEHKGDLFQRQKRAGARRRQAAAASSEAAVPQSAGNIACEADQGALESGPQAQLRSLAGSGKKRDCRSCRRTHLHELHAAYIGPGNQQLQLADVRRVLLQAQLVASLGHPELLIKLEAAGGWLEQQSGSAPAAFINRRRAQQGAAASGGTAPEAWEACVHTAELPITSASLRHCPAAQTGLHCRTVCALGQWRPWAPPCCPPCA